MRRKVTRHTWTRVICLFLLWTLVTVCLPSEGIPKALATEDGLIFGEIHVFEEQSSFNLPAIPPSAPTP